MATLQCNMHKRQTKCKCNYVEDVILFKMPVHLELIIHLLLKVAEREIISQEEAINSHI